jgi:hypothetical protein
MCIHSMSLTTLQKQGKLQLSASAIYIFLSALHRQNLYLSTESGDITVREVAIWCPLMAHMLMRQC